MTWVRKTAIGISAIAGLFLLVPIILFFIYSVRPYIGQSQHGNQVEAEIAAILKTNRQEFPLALVAPFDWHHVCYTARGVPLPIDVAKKMGIATPLKDFDYPWFGDRDFWTLIFVSPDQKFEVVRLSVAKTGNHSGYVNLESYCLPRDQAVFEVTPDKYHVWRLTLVKREWVAEETLDRILATRPEHSKTSAELMFPFEWKTLCTIPNGYQQFEVSKALGVQIEWHSVLYPWIASPDHFSLLFSIADSDARVMRVRAQQYDPLRVPGSKEITCLPRDAAMILVRRGHGGSLVLSLTN